jgi:transposase
MSKQYVPWTPEQSFLLPPSPREWLPEDHLVYFVLDVVAGLSLDAIERAIQGKDARGNRPFNPRMMVALLLYGYCVGIASSRKLERATHVDVAFRVLTGGLHPDHTAISEFRRVHLEALTGLFVQVLQLCQKAGLVKLGHVALDGTKVKANASKHKAMSHERMSKSEKQLEEEVQKLMAEAEHVDEEEDERYGKDKRGDELPEELRRRKTRLEAIQRAKQRLEAEAAQARAEELKEQAERAQQNAEQKEGSQKKADERAEEARKASEKAREKAEDWTADAQQRAHEAGEQARTRVEHCAARAAERAAEAAERHQEKVTRTLFLEAEVGAEPSLPEHRVQADAEGNPKPNAQLNFTDPDSRIMKSGLDFVQAYNCQAIVSEGHQIIVAQAATNQPPDVEHLMPLVSQMEGNLGQLPQVLTADAGYWSEENASFCEAKGVDAFIAVERQKHGLAPLAATEEKPPTPKPDAREPMRQKLRTQEGRKAYSRRKAVVEPVFGQIKEVRGFRRFLLRGIEKVRGEWSLICTGHNLSKLFNATKSASSKVVMMPAPA